MIFALLMAMVVNCFILILAAGTFHYKEGDKEVDSVERAYELLSPAVGAQGKYVHSALFAFPNCIQSRVRFVCGGVVVQRAASFHYGNDCGAGGDGGVVEN